MSNNTIILVSPFNATVTNSLLHAFKKLHFNVSLFDYRNILGNLRFNPLFSLLLFPLSLFISGLGHEGVSHTALLNKWLLLFVFFVRPDYIFVVKGELIQEHTLFTLKNWKVKTIIWQVDPVTDPFIWKTIENTGKLYDFYITCEPGKEIAKLKKFGLRNVLYMLGAADGTRMEKKQVEKFYDIVLVGSYHPNRVKYLKALIGLDMHIWGWGPWEKSTLNAFFEGKALSHKEMLEVYRRAKIIINIGRNSKSSIPTNLRPFEAAQVGGFILLEYKSNLNKVFALGKEIDTFRSPLDLRNKVEYYLSQTSRRDTMAHNLFDRVQKEHTYEKRLLSIFKKIIKRKN